MNRILRRVIALMGLAAVLGFGCWLEVWNTRGDAILRWTIEGGASPQSCSEHGAVRVEARFTSTDGDRTRIVSAPCDAFITNASLAQGWYTADVMMVGDSGMPVSSPRTISPFRVPYHGDVYVEVDFPDDAFPRPALTSR